MKRVLTAACCIVLCSLPALAKEKAAEAKAMSDQQFVDFAAQTDMVEANLGQLAGSAASAQPVKDYGQMLVADHTKDYNQLFDVAHQANLNMPNAIDAEHNKAMIDPFREIEGGCLRSALCAGDGGWTYKSDRHLQEGSSGRAECGSEVLCRAGVAGVAKASGRCQGSGEGQVGGSARCSEATVARLSSRTAAFERPLRPIRVSSATIAADPAHARSVRS